MVHAQPPDACHGGIKLLNREGEVQPDRVAFWTGQLETFDCDVLVVGHTHQVFAEYMLHHFDQHPSEWLALKGIGPWTVSYALLRGLSEPDCFLDTDLVIKKAIAPFENFNPKSTSPWGSYATFHCWSSQP